MVTSFHLFILFSASICSPFCMLQHFNMHTLSPLWYSQRRPSCDPASFHAIGDDVLRISLPLAVRSATIAEAATSQLRWRRLASSESCGVFAGRSPRRPPSGWSHPCPCTYCGQLKLPQLQVDVSVGLCFPVLLSFFSQPLLAPVDPPVASQTRQECRNGVSLRSM